MSTVLWGKRPGDIQYASREYWRHNIPIDPAIRRVTVDGCWFEDSGVYIEIGGPFVAAVGNELHTIAGREGQELGMRPWNANRDKPLTDPYRPGDR